MLIYFLQNKFKKWNVLSCVFLTLQWVFDESIPLENKLRIGAVNRGVFTVFIKSLPTRDLIQNKINDTWESLRNSHYIQSVAVLGTGTVIAQIMSIAVSPLLTRLYSPSDFGVAALFTAIIGSIASIVCGKYDMAIVVEKKIDLSRQLLGIAFHFALIVSLITLLGILIVGDYLINLLNADLLGGWIYLVPFMLLITGILTAFNYYSNRINHYKIISQSKILLTVIALAINIILGLLGLYYGLIISGVLATTVVCVWLAFRYRKVLNKSTLLFNQQKHILIKRYSDFPIYNATTALLDGITLAIPVFFLSRYFPEAVVGYYALVLRVAKTPILFFCNAISQVNLKKVADLANANQPIQPYLFRITLFLLAIIIPFAVIMIIFAPPLFAWVFGNQWREAGLYLQILMPSLAFKFVVSTVSTTIIGTAHNRLYALWNVAAFIFTLIMLIFVAPKDNIVGMLIVIMITDLLLYAFYYVLIWYAAKYPNLRHRVESI